MKNLNKILLLALVVALNTNVGFAQSSSKKKLSDDERMEWWRDSKFGMFIHWGSVFYHWWRTWYKNSWRWC
ncbi:alpha-L-fucosidase [Algibacter lectus]|uniref:alpha-L-fucosidase n=1 Tax=Algibacter lectus TaxID=221126 RepID=UPI0034E61814